jgi:hypothetical protein
MIMREYGEGEKLTFHLCGFMMESLREKRRLKLVARVFWTFG